MSFLTTVGFTKIFCSSRLVLERKSGKRITEIRILIKVFRKNFPLSEAEDNREGIAYLFLLRTLLAIWQKSWESSF